MVILVNVILEIEIMRDLLCMWNCSSYLVARYRPANVSTIICKGIHQPILCFLFNPPHSKAEHEHDVSSDIKLNSSCIFILCTLILRWLWSFVF